MLRPALVTRHDVTAPIQFTTFYPPAQELDITHMYAGHAPRTYELAGMVTFYSHHHVAYVLCGGQWMRADDEAVRVVGDLAAVRETGTKGKEKPVLVFFRGAQHYHLRLNLEFPGPL